MKTRWFAARLRPRRCENLREHHRFILGIPLTHYDKGAAPLVVWEDSHEIVRQTLRQCYGNLSAGYLIWIDGVARIMVDAGGGTFTRFHWQRSSSRISQNAS